MANPAIEEQYESAIKDSRYDGTRYALLCDYRYFSGNHAAEIACKEEFELPLNQYGIKEVEVGPFYKGGDKSCGENWEWFFIPCPTTLFTKYYGPGGEKAGQRPLACQVEESGTLYYGTLDEMIEKMKKFQRPMVLFQL